MTVVERAVPIGDSPKVAYFTMEVALENALPTFSGGLGVLAGDFLHSAADLGLPLVAVSLVYRDGYFRQEVGADGIQQERPERWDAASVLERLDVTVELELEGRSVRAGAWRYELVGVTGARVPVYFLDTDLEDNDEEARAVTDQLYGGDERHRLRQEALLGIGGVELLRSLGHDELTTFHMNEGHSSLLTLRLLELTADLAAAGVLGDEATLAAALAEVRARCVFTTHTPVPAGHDRFPAPLVEEVLGPDRCALLAGLGLLEGGELNMSELGIGCSRSVNAVSRRHREVAQAMFPKVPVGSITNGIHVARWAAPSVRGLFDEYLESWRRDSAMLRYATAIPLDEVAAAHAASKASLLASVEERTGRRLDPDALTIGLARRVTTYKQTTLLFSDLDRLREMVAARGPLQVVVAGKAHPRDDRGKEMIERVVEAAGRLGGTVETVFVENYDLEVAALLCAGADLWLNYPAKPNEASGTSGMKAALNGVPSLSVLDGWWIEGCIEGVTGWAIGDASDASDAATTAGELYEALENSVMRLFYGEPLGYAAVRRNAMALNGSFFSTDRMALEYAREAYGL